MRSKSASSEIVLLLRDSSICILLSKKHLKASFDQGRKVLRDRRFVSVVASHELIHSAEAIANGTIPTVVQVFAILIKPDIVEGHAAVFAPTLTVLFEDQLEPCFVS